MAFTLRQLQYFVAVAEQGRPSSGESVAVIDREWARLR